MIFFRIGCIALLITACLHLVGHFIGPIPENDTEKQMLDLMINYNMNIGSETVTMMGLYKGFSLCFSLLFLWTGFMGLFLSKNLAENSTALRKAAYTYTIALGIMLAISLVYFFMIPTTCISVAFVFFAIAAFRIK